MQPLPGLYSDILLVRIVHTIENIACNLDNTVRRPQLRLVVDNWLAMPRNIVDTAGIVEDIVVPQLDMLWYYPLLVLRLL